MPQPPLNPPFRAEHIGSFFRPQALLEAREASAGAARLAEDAIIRDFVRLQEDLGFAVVTDGVPARTYTANFTTSGLTGINAEQIGEGGVGPIRMPQAIANAGGSRPWMAASAAGANLDVEESVEESCYGRR